MIEVKKEIGIPKYKQIINAIENAIENGLLKKGDQLPSINTIKNNNKLSRDTVLMAFNELKNRGIIESIVGKGYYVISEDINVHQKIFLLFDELNSFKEDLYNSFLENLEDTIQVDIFFHHFNEAIFKKLIKDNAGSYNYYVIMPANLENTSKSIQLLPDDKVYILDQVPEDLVAYPSIYQNFEKSIYENLTKASGFVSKYNKINLIFSEEKQPKGILKGFTQFCEQSTMPFEILSTVKETPLIKGELYVLLDDISLLRIIKKMKSQNMTLVNDIGVISYNDTLLKEIVEGGITTITTDFNEMGKRLAKMILNKEQDKVENPNKLIIRNSI
ncbi:GntR family transcriptional regulator [Polaribacter sp. R2A056_3_33]|jgi:DNA-binding GntR family transcriptional regulator|uniref:GntR family transcriptional regulator n=1 Tax=unclassified Polaribacter TaxID=196858 RepID=UPI001C4EB739|nr:MULTISPECIES: GntR family transcriptional regulator [unclassified Polaribacter]QXP64151.1 GntR family transcriptional regulator [Polaribacter sp. HaHaR_3_91]QXP72142.1 GntR family transcriptional regulator [Polaribacter sp. R2A056_3_33]